MIEIIPAIDILEGKCVRLTRGKFETRKLYDPNPLAVARRFEEAGLRRLHLVDLDGARTRRVVNWRVLETIAGKTSLRVDFGGGVQSEEDLQLAFDCGARQVNLGSVAVKDRPAVLEWLRHWGSERLILSADVQQGNIAIHGWQERTEMALFQLVDAYRDAGLRYLACTDISRDGMLQGPALDLYRTLRARYPDLFIIASGGVSRAIDITSLAENRIDGVIIGKALYEGKVTLDELRAFLC